MPLPEVIPSGPEARETFLPAHRRASPISGERQTALVPVPWRGGRLPQPISRPSQNAPARRRGLAPLPWSAGWHLSAEQPFRLACFRSAGPVSRVRELVGGRFL